MPARAEFDGLPRDLTSDLTLHWRFSMILLGRHRKGGSNIILFDGVGRFIFAFPKQSGDIFLAPHPYLGAGDPS